MKAFFLNDFCKNAIKIKRYISSLVITGVRWKRVEGKKGNEITENAENQVSSRAKEIDKLAKKFLFWKNKK